MLANNPLAPQAVDEFGEPVITVETAAGIQRHLGATSSTYFHQLVAFRDAIDNGSPFPTTADDAVRNMAVVDACYRAAGLRRAPDTALKPVQANVAVSPSSRSGRSQQSLESSSCIIAVSVEVAKCRPPAGSSPAMIACSGSMSRSEVTV